MGKQLVQIVCQVTGGEWDEFGKAPLNGQTVGTNSLSGDGR